MFGWLSKHSDALNVILNSAILLVWVTYLQLLLMTFMRQRRSSIIINRGAGRGTHAHCLISNMSAEPIYIQHLIAVLRSEKGEWKAAVTDLDEEPDETRNLADVSSQGPLGSGEFFDAGTFAGLGKTAAARALAPSKELHDYDALELTVVAAYGPDKLFVAAARTFSVSKKGELTPDTVSTQQIRSRSRRREIDRFLRSAHDGVGNS